MFSALSLLTLKASTTTFATRRSSPPRWRVLQLLYLVIALVTFTNIDISFSFSFKFTLAIPRISATTTTLTKLLPQVTRLTKAKTTLLRSISLLSDYCSSDRMTGGKNNKRGRNGNNSPLKQTSLVSLFGASVVKQNKINFKKHKSSNEALNFVNAMSLTDFTKASNLQIKSNTATATTFIATSTSVAATTTALAAASISDTTTIVTNSTSSNNSTNDNNNTNTTIKYTVYCDLDGVLVDFEHGIKKLFNGKLSHQITPKGLLYKAMDRAPDYFKHLPWMSDGQALWKALVQEYIKADHASAIKELNILTGVTMSKNVSEQKFAWCQRELVKSSKKLTTKSSVTPYEPSQEGVKIKLNHVSRAGQKRQHTGYGRYKTKHGHNINNNNHNKTSTSGVDNTTAEISCNINVITCWSRNKHLESGKNKILIDDRQSLQEAWEDAGGIFILHTSTESTLEALIKLGVITPTSLTTPTN